MLTNIISISLGAILINNFIFSQFLGCCPFLGCSNKVDTAVGMGLAVTFVMGLASAICWVIDQFVLVPLGLAFLQTLTFILVIAALVQFVEMFLKKMVPSLYSAPFGIYECADGYISIAMGPFDVLVDALETPELMKYYAPEIRFDKRDEVFYAIEAVTKTKPVDYWLDRMLERDLWVAKVEDITDVENNPQVQHMHALSSFEHKKVGTVRCVAPAVTMSETPAEISSPSPLVGEHTREILREYGCSEADIDELFNEGIVSEEV